MAFVPLLFFTDTDLPALPRLSCCRRIGDGIYKRLGFGVLFKHQDAVGIFMIRSRRHTGVALGFALAVGLALAPSMGQAADGAASFAVNLPEPLSAGDAERYRQIFHVQQGGDWKRADELIHYLTDKALMGHVLAQRYLHPTKYRSKYKELKDWMDAYADHPDARRIYKLALHRRPANWRRPKVPVPGTLTVATAETEVADRPPGKKLSKAQRRQVHAWKRQIKGQLRKGYTKAVKQLLGAKDVRRLFSDFDMDEAKARLAAGYFAAGRDEWAVTWATEAGARSGRWLPQAWWTAGLAAWRLGRAEQAADYFDRAAAMEKALKNTSGWTESAAAFWAARAHLVAGNPQKVAALLRQAAEFPRTFYGVLARTLLGMPATFKWQQPEIEQAAIDTLAKTPAGHRALALLQVGESLRAERDLRGYAGRTNPEIAGGILALASRANLPGLAVRLNDSLYPDGGGFDSAAYPLPYWQPDGGYSIDRALVFALIRQESRFNPRAKSWAGARGLMQLMPRTASFVARDRRFHRTNETRDTLFDPAVNLKLGQKYIEILLADARVKGDLFLMATAWNGGPGNLRKWRRDTDDMNDPLFFIESIPSRETRAFVEHVLTNLWSYRDRLGQPTPSLTAIAAGHWPSYHALDGATQLVAEIE